MKALYVFTVLTTLSLNGICEVSRIENFHIDRKRVNKIYLSYSKTGVVRFPDEIEEVRVGAPEGYKYEVSKIYRRELSVKLAIGVNVPSNLIVRTSNEDIYVFDLIPSRTKHQDVVFVDESFYRTKIMKNYKPVREKIYSNKGPKRIMILKSKKKIIYSHRPKKKGAF